MPPPAAHALRELRAPGFVLLVSLPGLIWAFPQALPPWRSVSIVCAWAGSGLISASLALMIREPHIARWMGGLERMYRWHHRSGVLGYVLLLVHPLALAAEGWSDSPAFAWQALAPRTQPWPVGLGWIALLSAMLGLATTFAVHLPYRRWRAFHMILGVAVVLGLLHAQAMLVVPAAAILGLLALAACAFAWRLLAADQGLSSRPYEVRHVEARAARMVELTLTPCVAPLAVLPGQFVMVAFHDDPKYHGCGEFHPFTVSGIDQAGGLRITIKSLGPCSERIQQMAAGVIARVEGPFGSFLSGYVGAQLWIAGGIGITPFVAELRAGPRRHRTTLIYLFRAEADAAFLEELKALSAQDSLLELFAVQTGPNAADFQTMLDAVTDIAEREVQLCGPPEMVEAAVGELRRRGVSSHAIHSESFDFR
jgi:predicted ferric reductase